MAFVVSYKFYTAEKNMTNILTLVPVGMDVGFDDRLEVLLC